MSKPHVTCYDMECDECPERDACASADEGETGAEQLAADAVDLGALVEHVNNLTGRVTALSESVNQMQGRLDSIIAAIVHAANEER